MTTKRYLPVSEEELIRKGLSPADFVPPDRLRYLIKENLKGEIWFGYDKDLFEVLDFLNQDFQARNVGVKASPLQSAQQLAQSCLKQVIKYGDELVRLEQEMRKRKGEKDKRTKTRIAPIPFEEILKRPEAKNLNSSIDLKPIDEAIERIRFIKLSIESVISGPPIFFDYKLRMSGDQATNALFRFLSLLGRVAPWRWRICAQCNKVFLRQRPRHCQFCSDQCRYAFQNASKSRLRAKRDLARWKRSKEGLYQ